MERDLLTHLGGGTSLYWQSKLFSLQNWHGLASSHFCFRDRQ